MSVHQVSRNQKPTRLRQSIAKTRIFTFADSRNLAHRHLVSTSISTASDKADEGSKKAPTVVEHCHTCAPITVPVAASVYIPVSMSLQMSFSSDGAVDLEVRLPEPPPPKHLI
ncbi:hypothetical protein MXD81_02640 [Microbacteriaceae bacterium K1510]|nr:hypothetical protein [Microbacteriaceae bacterium K1510]